MNHFPKILRWLAAPLALSFMEQSTPDTSRQDAVAADMAKLSREQFDWVKQKYAEEEPARDAAAARANAVSDAQLAGMQQAQQAARQSQSDYMSIYRPQEIAAAQDAASYNTEAKREELAGKAKADVNQAFADAQGAAERDAASYGVNPADPAAAGARAGLQRSQALALTYGANKARTDAETLGRALRADVIGTGRGVVGSQGTQAGLAITSGNASANTGAQPVAIGQSGVNMVQQGAGQAVNGLSGAANVFQNSSNQQWQSQQAASAGVGSLVGAGMTAAAIF